jgi:hypothetical protein
VTQAVDGRAGPRRALADPGLAEQAAEGRLHGGLAQPRPGRRHQQARRRRRRAQLVAHGLVAGERFERGHLQRQLA